MGNCIGKPLNLNVSNHTYYLTNVRPSVRDVCVCNEIVSRNPGAPQNQMRSEVGRAVHVHRPGPPSLKNCVYYDDSHYQLVYVARDITNRLNVGQKPRHARTRTLPHAARRRRKRQTANERHQTPTRTMIKKSE